MSQPRRLAAILAADVAGYSRLIGADEAGTQQALQFKEIQAELGFGHVVDAPRRATEVQTRNGRAECFGGERARPSSRT